MIYDNAAIAGGTKLWYLWSSVLGQPVVELGSTGNVYRAYVYSPGGQQVAQQSYDTGFHWTHTNHLGSGYKMTDSTGAVVFREEFDPHGQTALRVSNNGPYYLSHKFTGYERDLGTNTDYANARQYHHNNGRFMQPDPLSLGASDLSNPQSLNLYTYVQNDPINYSDPTGLLIAYCHSVYVEGKDNHDPGSYVTVCEIISWGGGPGVGGTGDPGTGIGTGDDGSKEKKDPVKELKDCFNEALNSFKNATKRLFDGEGSGIATIVGSAIGGVTGALAGGRVGGVWGAVAGGVSGAASPYLSDISAFNRAVEDFRDGVSACEKSNSDAVGIIDKDIRKRAEIGLGKGDTVEASYKRSYDLLKQIVYQDYGLGFIYNVHKIGPISK